MSAKLQPINPSYDVVVVGGRAAGAATAMLLARAGADVLVVDRSAYGSDTLSSHALMRGAVNQLGRWGLLDRIAAVAPPIERTVFEFGSSPVIIDNTAEASRSPLYAPRRTVLDPIVVDAAAEAGAEFRFNTRVVSLLRDSTPRVTGVEIQGPDGPHLTIRCRLVVGADGLRSFVARAVDAPITRRGEHSLASIYAHVEGAELPAHDYRFSFNHQRVAGAIPTTGNAHCVFAGFAPSDLKPLAALGTAAALQRILEQVAPEIAGGARAGTIIGPVRSFPGHPGQFRAAHGPGWALVGDAGYFKDPAAAHGLTDAFHHAELLTDAIIADDLPGYEFSRDELALPLFEHIEKLGQLDWHADDAKRILFDIGRAAAAESSALTQRLAAVPALNG